MKQILAKLILKANEHYVDQFYKACLDCKNSQTTFLRQLLDIWRHHPLLTNLNISTTDEYLKNMPIQSYESLKPYLEDRSLFSRNPLLAYLKTSGSSSEPKFIPFTKSCSKILRESWTIWGWYYFSQHFEDIDAKILKVESFDQNKTRQTHIGLPVYSMNSIIETLQKHYVKRRYTKKFIPKKTLLFAANPYTLFKFLKREHPYLKDSNSDKIKAVTWKHGSMSRYITELIKTFPSMDIYDPGYQASEGFFALPKSEKELGSVLNIQRYFFEFLEIHSDSSSIIEDLHSNLIPSDSLQVGKQYRIYITSLAGLFRYPMNDIIECTGYFGNTPKIIFVQKTSEFISLCGEKISAAQVNFCIKELSKRTNISVDMIRMVAVPYIRGLDPYYIAVFFMDETHEVFSITKQRDLLGNLMDEILKQSNCEYLQKRESQRIQAPKVGILPKTSILANTFQILQQHHNQYKPKSFIELKEIDTLLLKELNIFGEGATP